MDDILEFYRIYATTYLIVTFIVAAGLGFIPASIARRKGYSFGLWWFYGWMIFIAAIIHVNVIPNKNAQQIPISPTSPPPPSVTALSAADELKKYKELQDMGVITEEEFLAKKTQLLKLI